jgi:hypothetical protein
MKRFELIVFGHEPDLAPVVGNVNSTLASAFVAAKMRVKKAFRLF